MREDFGGASGSIALGIAGSLARPPGSRHWSAGDSAPSDGGRLDSGFAKASVRPCSSGVSPAAASRRASGVKEIFRSSARASRCARLVSSRFVRQSRKVKRDRLRFGGRRRGGHDRRGNFDIARTKPAPRPGRRARRELLPARRTPRRARQPKGPPPAGLRPARPWPRRWRRPPPSPRPVHLRRRNPHTDLAGRFRDWLGGCRRLRRRLGRRLERAPRMAVRSEVRRRARPAAPPASQPSRRRALRRRVHIEVPARAPARARECR